MSLMRTLGKLGGKMGSNKELISGVMEGMDPRALAEAINENADMMGKVVTYLDAKVMADSMSEGLAFAGEMMKYLDPQKVADVINKNERLLPRYVECINPNVFTRSAGAAVSKLRMATYRPPMFGGDSED
ncbi:MAG TPA: hypothetical protein VIK22_03420 [Candidatus Anoxymicrobiaceae bacterium]